MDQFNILDQLRGTIGIAPQSLSKFLLTLGVILSLWLARRVMMRAVERRVKDIHLRYRWRKITSYIASGIGLLFITRIWISGFSSLTTMLGLISAGIAIALKEPLVNLAGWLFILWRQPFSVGDRIEIGETVAGDVIDQRVFAFTLMEIGNWVDGDQSTGRIVHVPNGRVFSQHIANYSKGFNYLWDEVAVLVTFESDWRRAKDLLNTIVDRHAEHLSRSAETRLREASRKFMIFYNKLTPIVYTNVEASGIVLTLRYLTEPQKRRGRRQEIWEDILDAFANEDQIDFAYPTQRMYLNTREGKMAVKKPTSPIATPIDPNDGFDDLADESTLID